MKTALLAALFGLSPVAGLAQANQVVVAGDWLPNASDAATAVAAVQAYVNAPEQPTQWRDRPTESRMEKVERQAVARNWDGYRLRIMGEVSGPEPALKSEVSGHWLIRLNGFCRADGDRWKSPKYTIFDGGDCYFHALYDPQSGRVVNFGINGGGIRPRDAAR